MREVDAWIRHRLCAYQLKQWKRGKTVFRELVARGMSRDAAARVAANAWRWWHTSTMSIHIALPHSLIEAMGLPSLVTYPQPFEPPGADPHDGWCGRGNLETNSGPLSRLSRANRAGIAGRSEGPCL